MAFDESLALRVRDATEGVPGLVEKKMFGGIAFLVHGNMSVGIHRSELVVRIDPSESVEALEQPGVRPFDITGRPMKGWLLVSADAVRQDGDLAEWVNRGLAFARSLPPK